jgi:hypothetical protein
MRKLSKLHKKPVPPRGWEGWSSLDRAQRAGRLAITYRRVGDLTPDPRNARTHPKRQIDQIKASIEALR